MDIEQIQKLINNKIEAGNKVKEVRKVIKTYKTQKQDMYDDTAEILKPSIDVQKKVKQTIDEKQDKIIKKLEENQEKIVEAIEFDPTKAITFKSEKLPTLDWIPYESEDEDKDEDEDEDEAEEVKPSTSEKKPQYLREAARIFRESKISDEKSKFFLFSQNIPFCELVSKKLF